MSPFLTMFSTLYGTHFPFQMHFKLLSAFFFNLDQSKILLSCVRLRVKMFQTCARSLFFNAATPTPLRLIFPKQFKNQWALSDSGTLVGSMAL